MLDRIQTLILYANVRTVLQATEAVHYTDMWATHVETFKTLSQQSMGLRMSGAAALNLCHVAQGKHEACAILSPCSFPSMLLIVAHNRRDQTAAAARFKLFFIGSLLCIVQLIFIFCSCCRIGRRLLPVLPQTLGRGSRQVPPQ